MSEQKKETSPSKDSQQAPVVEAPQETEPAQEWGERHSQAKAIARGGKDAGEVPGADEQRK